MKKLDSKGWGLSTMIGFMVGLVIFLLIAVILSVHYGVGRI